MQNARLTRQNGSVATFTVVGVVLALCVVGGIFLIQKRSQESSNPASVAVNTRSTSPEPSKSPVASSSPKATPKSSKTASPAPSKTKTPQSSPAARTTPVSTDDKLPVTGPEDSLGGALMLASLVGVLVAYIRSSRVEYTLRAE